jgi:hypothetical protein
MAFLLAHVSGLETTLGAAEIPLKDVLVIRAAGSNAGKRPRPTTKAR